MLSQFNQNPLPLRPSSLTPDEVPHSPPSPNCCLITLAHLQQESCEVDLPQMFSLGNFHPLTPTLVSAYNSPLAQAVF